MVQPTLTCVQQQAHHAEVGVGDAVVEGCVAVAVGHVDHVLQQDGGQLGEGHEVVGDAGGLRRLRTGHAEPLQLHRVSAGQLGTHEDTGTQKMSQIKDKTVNK